MSEMKQTCRSCLHVFEDVSDLKWGMNYCDCRESFVDKGAHFIRTGGKVEEVEDVSK